MSEGLAYAEQVPAHDQAWPAYGGLAAIDAADDVTEHSTGGKDWLMALAIFAPVGAVYLAIGYGLWVVSSAVS